MDEFILYFAFAFPISFSTFNLFFFFFFFGGGGVKFKNSFSRSYRKEIAVQYQTFGLSFMLIRDQTNTNIV